MSKIKEGRETYPEGLGCPRCSNKLEEYSGEYEEVNYRVIWTRVLCNQCGYEFYKEDREEGILEE